MNLLDLAVKITCDDQASSKVDEVAGSIKDKLGRAVSAGAKAIGATVAAAGAGALAVGKAALDSYASFEQLEGGIDKLFGTGGKNLEEYAASIGTSVEEAAGKFDALNQAHDLVMENAQRAFQTTGQSANEYMEQVSGFSAALVNSLGGDTVAAAEKADIAMRAISDNVNTFGSDVDSVSTAFQGFAKQNYTMLDNLKLGYGGTKTEMERLIADANEWGAANGRASDLSIESFSDVITAIEQIQEKQQIAGTTAREASQTIEGSISATKAAWENFLTELGKEDGDIGARMEELAESAGNVTSNVIPRIEQIADGLAVALPSVVSKGLELGGQAMSSIASGIASAPPGVMTALGEGLASAVTSLSGVLHTAVQSLVSGEGDTGFVDATVGMLSTVGSAIVEAAPLLLESVAMLGQFVMQKVVEFLPTLYEGMWGLLNMVVETVTSAAPQMLDAAGQFIGQMLDGVVSNLPSIVQAVVDGVLSLIDTVIQNGPQMLVAAGEFILSILTAIVTNLPGILAAFVQGVASLIAGVVERVPEMLAAGVQFIGGLLMAIGNALPDMLSAIGDLVRQGIDSVGGFVGDMLSAGANLVQGLIDGILGSIAGVGNALMSGIGGAVDEFMGFLGIASPSKLFKEFGNFTMEGFAIGIEANAEEAERAMRDAAKSVYGAADGTIDINNNANEIGMPGNGMQVQVFIDKFTNNSDRDARTLAQMIGEYTVSEMRARGVAC